MGELTPPSQISYPLVHVCPLQGGKTSDGWTPM